MSATMADVEEGRDGSARQAAGDMACTLLAGSRLASAAVEF